MNDATGHGWQQHIIHGTSMALKHSGPTSCRSGPGFAFFIQARIFEISRTILFNEPTFLTEPEWVSLSRDMWTDKENLAASKNTWTSLDSLLDIMVMCSSLRVRSVVRTLCDHMVRLCCRLPCSTSPGTKNHELTLKQSGSVHTRTRLFSGYASIRYRCHGHITRRTSSPRSLAQLERSLYSRCRAPVTQHILHFKQGPREHQTLCRRPKYAFGSCFLRLHQHLPLWRFRLRAAPLAAT